MVDQVAPAAARLPPRAQGVGPQGNAVVHIQGRIFLEATRGRGGGHVFGIAALNSTLLAVSWKTNNTRLAFCSSISHDMIRVVKVSSANLKLLVTLMDKLHQHSTSLNISAINVSSIWRAIKNRAHAIFQSQSKLISPN